MQKKSFLSLLLALVLVVGLMISPVAAATGDQPRLVLDALSSSEQKVGISSLSEDCLGIQITLEANTKFEYLPSESVTGAGMTAVSNSKGDTLYVVSRTPLPAQDTLWLGTVKSVNGSELKITGNSGVKLLDSQQVNEILGGLEQDQIGSGGESGGNSGDNSGGALTYGVFPEETSNGSLHVTYRRAEAGTRVTVTATPDRGYELKGLTVTTKSGLSVKLTETKENTYTFSMPKEDVTVKASFVLEGQAGALPFVDVSPNAWYYTSVEYVYQNGLMSGVNSQEFGPDQTLTRAMIAQILYAMEGKPQQSANGAFTDISSGDWYAAAVNWAASRGIVSGVGEGLFAPNASITREQLAMILYRYAQDKGQDVSKNHKDLTGYVDYATMSPWAKDAMEWAVGSGLISGMDGGRLAPTGTATRAQVATMLMQFAKQMQ